MCEHHHLKAQCRLDNAKTIRQGVEVHKSTRATYEIVVKTSRTMQRCPFLTMHAMKNMDPDKIERMVTNAM
jgi:hypothetical protein